MGNTCAACNCNDTESVEVKTDFVSKSPFLTHVA